MSFYDKGHQDLFLGLIRMLWLFVYIWKIVFPCILFSLCEKFSLLWQKQSKRVSREARVSGTGLTTDGVFGRVARAGSLLCHCQSVSGGVPANSATH